MKIIVFVRHAKSSWNHDVSDLNRPLCTRGISDANLVSNVFNSYNFIPDRVFSSPATRARSTCQLYMDNLGLSRDRLTIDEMLYDFGGDQVMRYIKELDNSFENVMLFGHNNAFTSLVNMLGDIYIDNLPTSGVVMINFDISRWEDIYQGTTQLVLKPKDFK